MASRKRPLKVESLTHEAAGRPNIPSAEHQPLLKDDERHPIEVAFERRNPDLDPQLVWRGKDPADWSDLVTQAPPLYIQEKVSPKALIDDLRKIGQREGAQLDFFADFNGLPEGADRTDFYQHQANWSNRMILGDSLQVMASLAEREGLRGQVQCIYIDPPYGIKFNSNFQWSTTSRDVKRRQRGPHHPRAGTGQGLPRHLARWGSFVSDLLARPFDRGPRPAGQLRFSLCTDWGRECSPGAGADG